VIFSCPGASHFKEPKAKIVKCQSCGAEAELWSDEAGALCPKCGSVVFNNMGQCCIGWCRHARECVSVEAYNNYMEHNRKGGV